MSVEPHDESFCDFNDNHPNKQQPENHHPEPLGYQHFLCDVNIEYNQGGDRTFLDCNKHTFKLKYLPYMIENRLIGSEDDKQSHIGSKGRVSSRKCSLASSSESSLNNCDNNNTTATTNTSSSSLLLHSSQQDSNNGDCYHVDSKLIDVTKETCAFLGNSDFVPNYNKNRQRSVLLELISAKLSCSTANNLSANSSHTSLVALAEQPTIEQLQHHQQINGRCSSTSSPDQNDDTSSNTIQFSSQTFTPSNNITASSSSSPIPPSPSSSSKRYVNYTILIKTMPGLDKHPAVIERRFSDFLLLFQGLKTHEPYAKLIDKHVTFPKKVYMGNFSWTNIAERSVEFSRLLSLCIRNDNLLWSTPFISFLLDKELKEAHRLSLFGDPDDVQSLIETSFYIEQKLYLDSVLQVQKSSTNSSSSISSEIANSTRDSANNTNSPLPHSSPTSSSLSLKQHQPNGGTVDNRNSPEDDSYNGQENYQKSFSSNNNDDQESTLDSLSIRRTSPSLNQRLLVTFCMLFLTYYKGENYQDLRTVVQNFSQMISSQEYVDSMLNTRHYMTLRACLLFLMNMNKGNVIDENQRLWLKRRLEDIDGAHADLDDSFNHRELASDHSVGGDNNSFNASLHSPNRIRRRSSNSNDILSNSSNNNGLFRITRGDLTSLIRDRNFCSFQDGKFMR